MAYADSEIALDFLDDWIGILRNELNQLGYPPGEDDRNLSLRYFNVRKRLVPVRPRIVSIAPNLQCPVKFRGGLEELIRKLRVGEDVKPHLSTRLADPDNKDGLLNDWGIYHLHLGTRPDPGGFVERTGPLLFARFDDANAYLITVQEHGAWADKEMLEVLHANWPAVTKPFCIPGITLQQNPTSEDIRTLRGAGVQTLVQLRDGTVLFPMGGGVMTSGLSMDVLRTSDHYMNIVAAFEDGVVRSKALLLASAEAIGAGLPRPVRLRFRLDQTGAAFAIADGMGYAWRIGSLP